MRSEEVKESMWPSVTTLGMLGRLPADSEGELTHFQSTTARVVALNRTQGFGSHFCSVDSQSIISVDKRKMCLGKEHFLSNKQHKYNGVEMRYLNVLNLLCSVEVK